jgi:hypothetical protein
MVRKKKFPVCLESAARCLGPPWSPELGNRGSQPVCQPRPGYVYLGLWLDFVRPDLAGCRGCVDLVAAQMPDQHVSHVVASASFFYKTPL